MNDITLRANILGGMNSYIIDVVGDEDKMDVWFGDGIPDGCDEDDLMDIAESEKDFIEIVELFYRLIK